MKMILRVNSFATSNGSWTIVRIDGDSYEYKDIIKTYGPFRYGYAFDDYVIAKAETGLEGTDFAQWLREKGDPKKKRWSLHWEGTPEENRDKLEDLSRTLGEACKHGDLEIREAEPVVFRAEQEEKEAQPNPTFTENTEGLPF